MLIINSGGIFPVIKTIDNEGMLSYPSNSDLSLLTSFTANKTESTIQCGIIVKPMKSVEPSAMLAELAISTHTIIIIMGVAG